MKNTYRFPRWASWLGFCSAAVGIISVLALMFQIGRAADTNELLFGEPHLPRVEIVDVGALREPQVLVDGVNRTDEYDVQDIQVYDRGASRMPEVRINQIELDPELAELVLIVLFFEGVYEPPGVPAPTPR